MRIMSNGNIEDILIDVDLTNATEDNLICSDYNGFCNSDKLCPYQLPVYNGTVMVCSYLLLKEDSNKNK